MSSPAATSNQSTDRKNVVHMTEIVMPQHTNPIGVIFGGVVMSWIDIASAIAASRHCKTHVTTASMDAMQFIKPIHLGWIVTIRASVNRVWNTSMEIGVQLSAENPLADEKYHTATAYLTMVALDNNGKSVKVKKVVPQTEDEIRRYRQAGERRALRLEAKKLR
jgi:acyl-CoA hydrolase